MLEKVRNRLRQNGLSSLNDYLQLLKRGDVGRHELDALIAELTVGETFFFRHPDHFDALRDHVLPACLARNAASRQLRIWSAGCSNGAEPYSIAIMVHSILGSRLKDWNVTIVGTDINRAFLADAEAASYSAWTLRGVEQERLPAYFRRQGQQWILQEKYKENVHFVYHNIINEEMPSLHKNIFGFDIVFCRNVMIYFDDAVNRLLVERINRVMVDDGWLFVGSTDFNPHLDATFTAVKASNAILYRKKAPVVAEVAAEIVVPERPAAPRRVQPRLPLNGERKILSVRERLGAQRARRENVHRKPATPPAAGVAAIQVIVDLANRGEWQEAAEQCKRILAADASNAPAYYYAALIAQSTGRHAEAEDALKRAIYLDRGFALAHYHLALARKDAHDIPGCIRSLRNALDALAGVADDKPVSPCEQITAHDLRDLTAQQLELLGETA